MNAAAKWAISNAPPIWYCAFWVALLPCLYYTVRKATHHGQRDRDRERAREPM